ncbi:MAG: Hsp33 family molecular chaperone HslO [Sulfobacillus sp.]
MHHPPDEILRASSEDGWLRLIAVRTTALTESARRRHHTSPVATAALGRTLTGCLMLGELSLAGARSRLTLRLIGDGPLAAVIADCDGRGLVRGYVSQPTVELPLRADGKLAVGQALGHGQLVVSRDLADGQIYTSSVPMQSGEIGEDLAAYLDASDQIPSAVGLGVRLDRSGRVVGAGGWLVQLMPGGEAHLGLIQNSTASMPPISQLMADSTDLSAVLALLAPGLSVQESSRHPVSFRCTCSLPRARRAVAMLGPATLAELVSIGQDVETRCHFCNRCFRIPVAEFTALTVP